MTVITYGQKAHERKCRSLRKAMGEAIRLAAIRRFNDKEQRPWCFHRLASYIEYRATLAGIEVEYANLDTLVSSVLRVKSTIKKKTASIDASVAIRAQYISVAQ